MAEFNRLWSEVRPAFGSVRIWQRARALALGALVGLGRRTITGLLTTTGQHDVDWSAAYRLFSCERFDPSELLGAARREVLKHLAPEAPFVAMLDDTVLRKRGKKISGTGWRLDRLGPKFHNNFIWAQRFLQVSAALPEGPGASRARAIPINLLHCPTPRKPSRKATTECWQQYELEKKASRITLKGAEHIALLRRRLDEDGQTDRPLIVSVDGGYTNSEVFRSPAPRTALIGRVRKDAKLFEVPQVETLTRRGRKRFYGKALPTPEAMRHDPAIAWQKVSAFAAGRTFDFDTKVIDNVRWRGAGEQDLRLLIVRPLAYRPTKNSRLLYRNPVYLICSDPALSVEQILQAYLWRWEIEVNFRDQKTLLGTGQAQVRKASSVERVPQLIAAAYGFLHLALHALEKRNELPILEKPRWQKRSGGVEKRISSQHAISLLRSDLWGKAIGQPNLGDFIKKHKALAKSDFLSENPASAVIYATS